MHTSAFKRAVPVIVGALMSAGALAGEFSLSSPDIADGERMGDAYVFKGFGCQGGNRSPALAWSNPPAGTQSYALTVYDPDAPTGSGWWHWVVVNLPTEVTALPAGTTLPAGVRQINTDFGAPGYGGPCPPVGHGPHRYIFTIHALKVPVLDLPGNATAAMAGYMINANRLGKASITSFYER